MFYILHVNKCIQPQVIIVCYIHEIKTNGHNNSISHSPSNSIGVVVESIKLEYVEYF